MRRSARSRTMRSADEVDRRNDGTVRKAGGSWRNHWFTNDNKSTLVIRAKTTSSRAREDSSKSRFAKIRRTAVKCQSYNKGIGRRVWSKGNLKRQEKTGESKRNKCDRWGGGWLGRKIERERERGGKGEQRSRWWRVGVPLCVYLCALASTRWRHRRHKGDSKREQMAFIVDHRQCRGSLSREIAENSWPLLAGSVMDPLVIRER